MKNKLTSSILIFLLLIPLRLPISILFIKFFKWIIGVSTTEEIPNYILATNVIITKIVFNIFLSCYFLYLLEMYSREKFGRKAQVEYYSEKKDTDVYWWIVPIGILLLVFIIVDAVSVNDIFFL